LAFLANLAAAKMRATGVDYTLVRLLVIPRCKIAKLGDALPLGAASVAIGQSSSEPVPTPAPTESNAKLTLDFGLSLFASFQSPKSNAQVLLGTKLSL
jgi:hypothetical protein